MHIFYPEYTWLFIYSILFVMFAVHSVFNRFIKQDLIPASILLVLIVSRLPYDLISDFTKDHFITIQEILLFVCSLSLITQKYVKKLLFYMFCIAVYFTMFSISHILHIEEEIIPVSSLFFIYGLYRTHIILPAHCPTKNNKYFIVLLLLIIQNLMQYSEPNFLYLILYVSFACYIACHAYFYKAYHHKIFYTFFAFFILTIAHLFLEVYIINTIGYTLLYSIIAYFVYSTIGIQYKQYVSWVFVFQVIFALLHVCYTVLNPLYFLISKIESQTISFPIIQTVITFTYFTIFLSVIRAIFVTLALPKTKKHNHIAKSIYITLILVTLLEVQILHSKLHEASDIIYSMVAISFMLQIVYLGMTFSVLTISEYIFKKYKHKMQIQFSVIPYISKIIFLTAKMQIKEYHTNLMLFFLQENINLMHRSVMVVTPVFLLFYLIVALFY